MSHVSNYQIVADPGISGAKNLMNFKNSLITSILEDPDSFGTGSDKLIYNKNAHESQKKRKKWVWHKKTH